MRYEEGQKVWFCSGRWSMGIRDGAIIGVFEDDCAIEDSKGRHLLVSLGVVFLDKKTAIKTAIKHIREEKRGIAAQRMLLDKQERQCDEGLEELQPREDLPT